MTSSSCKQWTRDQITQKVCELAAAQAEVVVERVLPETRLIEDLNYDSLMEIELVMKLEDEFGIQLPDSEVDPGSKMPQSVAEFADVVEAKLREEAPPGASGV